ncbi:MAG TPA: potassium-transporting ATPase subunit C [Solirubrobacteraceae bacterium]|nr:potassium-transporting ATPase subunit C [Solirubrobacteraceae bacterium]
MLAMLRRHFISSIVLTAVVLVFLTIYVAVVYAIGQVAFKQKVDGSFIIRDSQVVGSSLIGQAFTNEKGEPLPQYFQSRPSQTEVKAYNASSSGASNFGPGSPKLIGLVPGFNTASKANPYATKEDPNCVPTNKKGDPVPEPEPGEQLEKKDGAYVCYPETIPERVKAYREFNGLPAGAAVPVDAVTASASGLDPEISIANADLQAPRVARVRKLPLATVMALMKRYTHSRSIGFLGEPGVRVLELNLALERTG